MLINQREIDEEESRGNNSLKKKKKQSVYCSRHRRFNADAIALYAIKMNKRLD